ncbi:MAG: hypothetical protein NZ750_07895 [Anaerolineae bacterium]|nr:hypothetical protein [Anaerolineae bacterium]MDW8172272.1 hypothetical protein [Anaerolineae bacterium]
MKRLLALLLLAACQAAPSTPDALPPDVLALADSWQPVAALWPTAWPEALFAWPASDAQGRMRLWAANPSRAPHIVALDSCQPIDVSLWPADRDRAHLLWLDCAEDGLGLRLYHAVLGQDGVAVLAQRALSTAHTFGIAALPLVHGSLLLAWVQGELGAEQAWALRLDGQGRGLLRQQVARSVRQVALLRGPDGAAHLLAQDDEERLTFYRLDDEATLAWSEAQALGVGRARRYGEARSRLQAAPSDEGLLLFWQWQDGARAWVEWAVWPWEGQSNPPEALRVLGQQPVVWARLAQGSSIPVLAAQWGQTLGLLRWTGQGFVGHPLAQAQALADPPLALLRPSGGLLTWTEVRDPLADLRLLVWPDAE